MSFTGTGETGLYLVRGQDYSERFVVNLFSDSESDIEPVFTPVEQPSLFAGPAHQLNKEVSRHFLYIALLLLIVEWSVYCQRVRGARDS